MCKECRIIMLIISAGGMIQDPSRPPMHTYNFLSTAAESLSFQVRGEIGRAFNPADDKYLIVCEKRVRRMLCLVANSLTKSSLCFFT